MKEMLDQMAALANADGRHVARGQHLSLAFKLDCGERYWLIDIENGTVAGIRPGPVMMPDFRFVIRCAEDHWREHWQARPRPGWQDIFGMQRHHGLTIEGDLHPFIANLFWFKDLLAMPRRAAGKAQAAAA